MEHTCHHCMNLFSAVRPHARFCSPACRHAEWRFRTHWDAISGKLCAHCGERLYPPKTTAKQKFCSTKCRVAAWRAGAVQSMDQKVLIDKMAAAKDTDEALFLRLRAELSRRVRASRNP